MKNSWFLIVTVSKFGRLSVVIVKTSLYAIVFSLNLGFMLVTRDIFRRTQFPFQSVWNKYFFFVWFFSEQISDQFSFQTFWNNFCLFFISDKNSRMQSFYLFIFLGGGMVIFRWARPPLYLTFSVRSFVRPFVRPFVESKLGFEAILPNFQEGMVVGVWNFVCTSK